jgi:hypothetical protein
VITTNESRTMSITPMGVWACELGEQPCRERRTDNQTVESLCWEYDSAPPHTHTHSRTTNEGLEWTKRQFDFQNMQKMKNEYEI